MGDVTVASHYNIPLIAPLNPSMFVGKIIIIDGNVNPDCQSIDLTLQTCSALIPKSDIALFLSVRCNQGYVIRNAYVQQSWGFEERSPSIHIKRGKPFQIVVFCEQTHFKVALNGVHLAEYLHRMPFNLVSHLTVYGQVVVTKLEGTHSKLPRQMVDLPKPGNFQRIIPGNLYIGRQVRIRGSTMDRSCHWFLVLLQDWFQGTVVFYFSCNKNNPSYVRIFRVTNEIEYEKTFSTIIPFGTTFELILICENKYFEVALNGRHYATVAHNLSYGGVQHLNVASGSHPIQVELVSFEGM